ncbi:MAG: 50S ribosomal protein L10 [Bdellovibrionota bacterium]
MNLQEKEGMVGELVEKFNGSELAVLIGYQGCTCEELTRLRKKLKPVGGQFAVVKNTLARRAVTGTERDGLKDMFVGPTAVVWSGEDPIGPAKVIKEFAKEIEKFTVKAGFVGEKVLSASEVETLASLPTREETLAKLLALINAPATRLLQTINAPASSLARLLGAWHSELEKRGN